MNIYGFSATRQERGTSLASIERMTLPSSTAKTGDGGPHRGRNILGKTIFLLLLVLILAAGGAYLFLVETGYFRTRPISLRARIHDMLMNELSMKSTAPRKDDAVSGKSKSMIYVMGGDQDRLKYQFETAAKLLRRGVAERIHILSRPGITEYSPKNLRNLTNDEWSVRELEGFGVSVGAVKIVPVPHGFFGTYSEGRTISRFAREMGVKRLILVASPHHARRVYATFSHFLDHSMDIYVEVSGGPASLPELLVEYGKYLWYTRVLIPAARIAFLVENGVLRHETRSAIFRKREVSRIGFQGSLSTGMGVSFVIGDYKPGIRFSQGMDNLLITGELFYGTPLATCPSTSWGGTFWRTSGNNRSDTLQHAFFSWYFPDAAAVQGTAPDHPRKPSPGTHRRHTVIPPPWIPQGNWRGTRST